MGSARGCKAKLITLQLKNSKVEEQMEKLAQIIKKRRLLKELTQAELGRRLEFNNRQMMSNIESERCPFPISKMPLLKKALGFKNKELATICGEERYSQVMEVLKKK